MLCINWISVIQSMIKQTQSDRNISRSTYQVKFPGTPLHQKKILLQHKTTIHTCPARGRLSCSDLRGRVAVSKPLLRMGNRAWGGPCYTTILQWMMVRKLWEYRKVYLRRRTGDRSGDHGGEYTNLGLFCPLWSWTSAQNWLHPDRARNRSIHSFEVIAWRQFWRISTFSMLNSML